MKAILFSWLIPFVILPAFSQSIPSRVYSWSQASVGKHAGYEERTLLQGTTRDFTSFSVQTVTQFAGQPAQPAQQLDEEVILVVKKGELTLTLNKTMKVLGSGSLVLVMPGDSYQLENKSSEPLIYYQIRYMSNEMPDLDLYRLAGGSFWIDGKEVPSQSHDNGKTRPMFDGGTVMDKRIEIQAATLNPGRQRHPTHTHRPAELILIMDNDAQASIAGTNYSAHEADVIFLESQTPHSIQNTGSKSCSYVAILFE